jgi:UDP-glucuronate decarboxylase
VRYLIAGGAGFIGSNLAANLLTDGHEVVCVDNLVTGRRSNLEPFTTAPGFTFIQHDLIEPLPELPLVDGIFHLASPASPPGYQRYAVETMRVNSEGTLRLVEFAALRGVPIVYSSTSEAYGDPLVHPQTEEYRGNVSTTGPRSMYDESKRYGEALMALFTKTRGVDGRIVRLFNTYGPNSDPADGRFIPNFITQALRGEPVTVYGDGQQTRSLCYVSDVIEGLRRNLATPAARGEVINLGNPEEHTVLEFAEMIIKRTSSASLVVYGPPAVGDDPQRRQPDIAKARRILDWEPEVALADGLGRTIAYFRSELGVDPAVRTP